MKRLLMLAMVLTCLLVPAAAHADDGGFFDWLFRMDPKFWGGGSEIHIACLDSHGGRVEHCEHWYRNLVRLLRGKGLVKDVKFDDIKHEVAFRFAYYRTIGDLFTNDPSDTRSINAWKLMAMYHYHFNSQVELGGGGGIVPLYGERFSAFSRGIVTPFSLVIAPAKSGPLTVQIEESYLTGVLSAARLGNTVAVFSNSGEWNFSFGVGIDLRRLR